jgi:glyoxylase-like metal-dependent hydrolase (beta-lactamase superfamily II)
LTEFKSETNKIEDVYQFKIEVPFDVKFVCVYLWNVGNKFVLFDAGLNMNNWDKIFFTSLQKIGISIKNIDYCIISHYHLDHIGLIKKFKRKNPDIKICMGTIEHEAFKWETNSQNFKELELEAKELSQQMVKFGITNKQGERLVHWFTMWSNLRRYQKPDVLLSDNDEICFDEGKKLKIMWTPGHSLGHICVFDDDKKYLFSGDHILSRITPHIGNFIVDPVNRKNYDFENILDHYLKSLDKIDKLNPKLIFPSHQEIISNPHERIIAIKEFHKNRLKEISNLIKNNPLTPLRISQIRFGENLDEINAYLALSEVISHLIYLESQEKVHRIEKNGKILFIS